VWAYVVVRLLDGELRTYHVQAVDLTAAGKLALKRQPGAVVVGVREDIP
jgi:hypothetical protein